VLHNKPTTIPMSTRVASTYHRSYYSARLLCTLVHTDSNTCKTFILFESCL